MTQRVRDGLGLPAGFYRLAATGVSPTFYAPNGITADGVASLIYANVVSVDGGYDWVYYNGNSGVFERSGSADPSLTGFNDEATAMADDVLHQIFNDANPGEAYPYLLESSGSRANIVGDLSTLQADFVLDS